MNNTQVIPYAQQWIDEDDVRAVAEVLHSPYIARGPKVEEFEKAIAKYKKVISK